MMPRCFRWFSGGSLLLLAGLASGPAYSATLPEYQAELIFPLEHWHNHASCVVECPNGDLLVCWYHGSGERTADDVKVLGARKARGAKTWSAPFVLADTPGFPDTNPCLFIDPQKRLWLFWTTILDNHWESALLKYRRTSDFQRSGPPRWQAGDVLHLKPGPQFTAQVLQGVERVSAGPLPDLKPDEFQRWLADNRSRATNRLSSRLGWMTRTHPYARDGRRFILPLYSDGFDFSLMALSDDGGENWRVSDPLIKVGSVQPALVGKRNGTLVAFMRDNGSRAHCVQRSQSTDGGQTWSPVTGSDRPDPGAGVDVAGLRNGHWVLVNNDLENERHRLAVALSEDEGQTWPWIRHLERDTAADIKAGAGSYHYPSVIQAADGSLHVTYSYHQKASENRPDADGKPVTESIKHARFNEAWIRAGDAAN
jgi:predicted neuraminidase